jgi:hypothetical protein
MSKAYADFLNSLYKQHKITAEQVWANVPTRITEAEATRICGPRPV